MKVLVIGESCTDIFIYGEVSRLSPEAPIPIIKPYKETTNKGMAENVKLNLEALGVQSDIVCNFEEIKKIRYVDDSYNYILLRIDENDSVSSLDITHLPNLNNYDIVVIADYNKGLLTKNQIKELSEMCTKPMFLDTKKKLGDWCKNIDFIKINFSEYKRSETFIKNNQWINEKMIVTRGPLGCDYNSKNFPTIEVGVKDVAGAGDTFLAGLIFKYIQTNSIEESIEFANKCSTQVVQKRGVSIINKDLL